MLAKIGGVERPAIDDLRAMDADDLKRLALGEPQSGPRTGFQCFEGRLNWHVHSFRQLVQPTPGWNIHSGMATAKAQSASSAIWELHARSAAPAWT